MFPVGPAAQSGQINVGDVILEVNGRPTIGLNRNDVLTLLRTAPQNVELLICRPPAHQLPTPDQLAVETDYSLRGTPISQTTSPPVTPGLGERGGLPDGASPSTTSHPPTPLTVPTSPLTVPTSPTQDLSLHDTTDSYGFPTKHLSVDHQRTLSHESDYANDNDSDIGDSASVVQVNNQDNEKREAEEVKRALAQSEHRPSALNENTEVPSGGKVQNLDQHPAGNTPAESGVVPQESGPARDWLHYMTPTGGMYGSDDSDTEEDSDEEEEARKTEQRRDGEGQPRAAGEQLQPGEFEVTMTKGNKGLGFTVAGGQNTTGYFYVKDILFDPALSDGRIEKGDRLMKVDDQDMRDLNHKEAVNYLRLTPNTVTIRFYRPPRVVTPTNDAHHKTVKKNNSSEPPSPNTAHRPVPSSTSPGADQSVQSLITAMEGRNLIRPHTYGQGHGAGTADSETDEDELEELEERHRSGMITPTHGLDSAPPTPSHHLSATTPQSHQYLRTPDQQHSHRPPTPGDRIPADEDGRVSQASSWGNMTLPMPDEVEEQNEEVQQITAQTPTPQEGGTIRVQLERPENGNYGFSLVQGERGTSTALYIRSVTPGTTAAERLQVGDKLLQVNHQSVIGMPHNKAVALIRKSNGTLNIAVSRAGSRSASRASQLSAMSPQPGRDSWSRASYTDTETHGGRSSSRAFSDGRETPCSTRTTPIGELEHHSEEDEESEEETFNSLDDDRHRYTPTRTRGSGAESDDGTDDDWNTHDTPAREKLAVAPEKPPRKGVSRLPAELTDEWLDSLAIVKVSPEAVHYTGRQLAATTRMYAGKLERDDPIEEYKTLRHAKLTDNCNDARRQENKAKNRYRNVLPYDSTRVYLSGLEDYINASHVRYQVGRESLQYIACQGPLPQTTEDFWRMVWEQKVDTIAMVTLDVEGGKVKCHRYWPQSMATPFTVCDKYEVRLLQTQNLENFDVHYIRMEDMDAGTTLRVTHVNFTTWPDHGTPDSSLPLLQYIRFLRLVHDSGPLVVHCSAGIGRTGALITMDIVLSMIEQDLKFDIHKVVTELRRQRQGMIQTKDQYVFCYKAALEALESLTMSQQQDS